VTYLQDGRELEVHQLFRDDEFRAQDPSTARPRQMDIVAIGHNMHRLIEVNDRRRLIFKTAYDVTTCLEGRTQPDAMWRCSIPMECLGNHFQRHSWFRYLSDDCLRRRHIAVLIENLSVYESIDSISLTA
jgi:hypothetical protein